MGQPPKGNDPKPFDLLASLAVFAQQQGVSLNDPALLERFFVDAASRLDAALADSALIHGARTERMFEATVLSLGRFKLFKTEDVGRVHAATTYRAPDFRVVLEDGDQWLIEVKNVRCENPDKQRTRMSATYTASLQAYAEAVGAPLRLAIFWSRWNLWTVIAPERFCRSDGSLQVTMMEALMANEFSRLGDVLICTKPPLRLILGAAIEKHRTLSSDGVAKFVIGSARVYSGDVELTDLPDRRLAELLLLYGDWPVEGPFAITGDDGIAGVEFVAAPEDPSDQGFDGVGRASQIFTRYYATQTVERDQVIQLNGAPVPEWFTPLASRNFKCGQLPLWLIYQQPSTAAQKPAVESAKKTRPA